MYDIIKGKLNWHIDEELYKIYLQQIRCFVDQINSEVPLAEFAHPLLKSLYKEDVLQDLYSIKDSIDNIEQEKYHLFFKLALSQTLHKTSIHPIAVPYISRNKILKNDKSAWDVFSSICQLMFDDTINLSTKELTSKIYKQDSRKLNNELDDNQCHTCITSPPYLNNLDYGEVSKVHTHFFDITNTWNDITNRVRKNLVTGSTTHYAESQFSLQDFRFSEFAVQNLNIIDALIRTASDIKYIANGRSGKKKL